MNLNSPSTFGIYVLLCLTTVKAQEQNNYFVPEWRFKTNIPANIFCKPNVYLEYLPNDRFAIEAKFAYFQTYWDITSSTFETWMFKGPEIETGIKKYKLRVVTKNNRRNTSPHLQRQNRFYTAVYAEYRYRGYVNKENCTNGSCGRSSTTFETRSVFKHQYFLRFQIGMEKTKIHLISEPFIGIGIMMQFVDKTLHWRDGVILEVLEQRNKYVNYIPWISLGIKWGFRSNWNTYQYK